MTVAELIERLRAFPPDTLVLVDDYESGQDPPAHIVPVLAWKVKPTGYTGSFEVADEAGMAETFDTWGDPRPSTVPAVLISCRTDGSRR